MGGRVSLLLTCILLVAAAGDASAMELDTLLPTDIPGYNPDYVAGHGGPPVIGVLDRVHPEYTPIGINLGDVTFDPRIDAGAGYDSNPNGAAASSSLFDLNPSITALDPILGFGAYVAGAFTDYPNAAEQNLAGYTIALGEHALLPRETLNVAIAAVATQETGFGLNTVAISNPIGVTVKDIRGDDSVIRGMVTLKPELSVTSYKFDGYSSQNRTDYRQSLTGEFTSGGPARFVAALHATESNYQNSVFNAHTYAMLAGVADEATGIWNIRLLAGAATRQPVTGNAVTAPVLEAAVGWMPTDLDSMTLGLARELDDPDQESAEGYTLSAVNIAIAHEYLRNVIITGSFDFSHAAYFDSPLIESLYTAKSAIDWHLDRAVSVSASYVFNDRQANFLKADNQHIFILGVTWSP